METSPRYSAKKNQKDTLPKEHGITQSNSKRTHRMRLIARYTRKHRKKTRHYKSSSPRKSRRDMYDHLNHLTHPPSSTSKRRTGSYDQYKITEKSTQSPYAISTRYPSSRTL